MMDLVSTEVGGRIIDCTDDFFAPAACLLSPSAPIWKEGEYTEAGKWMDGWESRRRRDDGHDWCTIALGVPGRIESVIVETTHFTGNHPEAFSIEACGIGIDEQLGEADWTELIGRRELAGDSTATFDIGVAGRTTHVRFHIYPDGGVARLRVLGTPIPARDLVCAAGRPVDLASALVGGSGEAASDAHYSSPANLVRPTDPAGMWDGWETKRRRGPGHDWAVVGLGLPGVVESIDVDTRYFRGNAPGWVSVDVSEDSEVWIPAVERQTVAADTVNSLTIDPPLHARHVRLNIFPDGGVARLRVWGSADASDASALRLEYVNSLFEADASRFFRTACASSAWTAAMVGARPFADAPSLHEVASAVFDSLDRDDWLEAFSAHPRIGERGDSTARSEQAGAEGATPSTLAELADINARYEDRFGFVYLVYATGKSAEEMLEIARSRISNNAEAERLNAAEQQRAITSTRLRSMLCEPTT